MEALKHIKTHLAGESAAVDGLTGLTVYSTIDGEVYRGRPTEQRPISDIHPGTAFFVTTSTTDRRPEAMATPAAFTDPSKLRQQIDNFIQLCESSRREIQTRNGDIKVRYDKPASMVGLADYLGVAKDTLSSYLSGERKHSIPEDIQHQITAELARARTTIERITLEHAATGDYDARIASMILGGMGYTSKTDDAPTVVVRIEGARAKDVDDWSR